MTPKKPVGCETWSKATFKCPVCQALVSCVYIAHHGSTRTYQFQHKVRSICELIRIRFETRRKSNVKTPS